MIWSVSSISTDVGWRIGRARASRGSVPGRVKSMTYKIDYCHLIVWHLTLIGYHNDWLVQCQDNMIEFDIRWWLWFDLIMYQTPNLPHASPALHQFGHHAWCLPPAHLFRHIYVVFARHGMMGGSKWGFRLIPAQKSVDEGDVFSIILTYLALHQFQV